MTTGSGEWARAMLKSVRGAVQALPTEDEIRAGVEAIDALVSFLGKLREQLLGQPTAQRREDAEKAILVIESFLGAHRGGVLLAKTPRRPPSKERADVTELRRELDGMSLDEVRTRLLDTRTSQKDLRTLARELQLRVDSRLPRADLVDAIFKRGFANPRGYDSLKNVSHMRGVEESAKANGGTMVAKTAAAGTPKTVAALAFAGALEIVLARHGSGSPSSYFHGAVSNIEHGGDASVDVNVDVLVKDIGDAVPGGFALPPVSDDLRIALRKKLVGQAPDVIREAADLLVRALGGNAQTYFDTWGKVPA